MTALGLIAESARLGIVLTPKGDKLRCRPKARMTVDLRARLKAHKADVLEALDELGRWPEGRPWWVDGIMDGPQEKPDDSPVGSPGYLAHLDRIRRTAAAKGTAKVESA